MATPAGRSSEGSQSWQSLRFHEQEGAFLANWLNEERGRGADKKRIVQLLLYLRQVREAIAAVRRADSVHPLRVHGSERIERCDIAAGYFSFELMNRGRLLGSLPVGIRSRLRTAVAEIMQDLTHTQHSEMDEPLLVLTDLLLRLYRMMGRYRSQPVVLPLRDGEMGWEMAGYGRSGVTLDEWDAFCTIAELGRRGLLDRMRDCPMCSKWIFARFSHQRFCSEACRVKAFTSTEEWKTKRRKQAYVRYWRKKLGTHKVGGKHAPR